MNKYIAERAYAEGVSIENYEERYLHWVETGEPMELYGTTCESLGSVYTTNLLFSMSYMGDTPLSTKIALGGGNFANNFYHDVQSDVQIYNRNPGDKYKAIAVSAGIDTIDFFLVFPQKIIPPIGAGLSTGLYYLKQGIKYCWIGY